jgi:hypothetical protein
MRRHVGRHAVDADGEVGAVVRLKPRRKYWLALPSPECWVTISPGTTSSASPTREKGLAFTSAPLMVMALAAVG